MAKILVFPTTVPPVSFQGDAVVIPFPSKGNKLSRDTLQAYEGAMKAYNRVSKLVPSPVATATKVNVDPFL